MKRYCNFCGEPMLPDAKECKQCGWDVSQNGPPTTDHGDRKARIGVAMGLAVAYGVLWFLVQGTPAPASAEAQKTPRYVPPPELIAEPVSEPATAIGTLSAGVASVSAPSISKSALMNIKVADTKATSIRPR